MNQMKRCHTTYFSVGECTESESELRESVISTTPMPLHEWHHQIGYSCHVDAMLIADTN